MNDLNVLQEESVTNPQVEKTEEVHAEKAKENGQKAETQKKNRWLKPVFVVLLVILVPYLLGVLYATQRFLPNTIVRGVEVDGLSAQDSNQLLKDQGLVLTIDQAGEEGVVSETIDLFKAADAKIDYDTASLIEAQDKFLWFKSFFTPTEFEAVSGSGSFDEDKIERAATRLYSQKRSTGKEAEDAYIKIDGRNVIIVPEKEGTAVSKQIAMEHILAAAEEMIAGEGSKTIDLSPYHKRPRVRAADRNLIAKKELLEKYVGRSIVIQIASDESEVLEGQDIADILAVEGRRVDVNEDALSAFAENIANKYYVNYYEHLEYDDLYAKLKKAILTEGEDLVEASWYINYPRPSTNGNGKASFIEVSIGYQYLWYFENGSLVLSSPVVTGQKGESPTPTGYFKIRDRSKDATLVGRDYETVVSYWMGIDNIGYYGIHDATWRGSFGADIYTYYGSHGCVNLPYWVAQSLFEKVKVDVTEVYIHE